MLKNFIVALLLIMFINSCDSTEPPIVENEPLIPLSVDNYWLYQSYLLDPDSGTVTSIEYNEKYGFIINKDTHRKDNNEYYQIDRCGEGLTPIDDTNYLLYGGSKLVYQNKSDFYYAGVVRKDSLIISFNDVIFPYPTKEGMAVRGRIFYYSILGNESNIPDEIITEYTCVSTDSLFSTPVGSFRCMVYKMPYIDLQSLFRGEAYYFIKPGLGILGIVQMTYFYNQNKYNYMRKYVLTEYKIN